MLNLMMLAKRFHWTKIGRIKRRLHPLQGIPPTLLERVILKIPLILMKLDLTEMQEKMTSLANLAYERELNRELSRVQRHIDLYRERESKFFNLKEIRFKFYREISDEIWRLYNRLEPDRAIERAVALGLLNDEEVPEEIRSTINRAMPCVS